MPIKPPMHRLFRAAVPAALLAIALPAAAEDPPKEAPPPWTVEWKEGLRIESPDKSALFRVGGRIHYDWGFFYPDDDLEMAELGPFADGTEFRRARLMAQGLVYDEVEFKAEFDFAASEVAFKDVYIGLRHVPLVGNVRAGHYKEPFGLEELASDSHVTFMERSLVSAFVPSRNTGISFARAVGQERGTLSAGLFREADDSGNQSGSGKNSVTGRLTVLPVWKNEGKTYLHVGGSASLRTPNLGTVLYRQRPEANLAPRLVSTGTLTAESATLLGGEFAFAAGPGSIQAEAVNAMVDAPEGSDPSFLAYSAQVAWTLTGEGRPYRRAEGVIGTIKPKNNHSFKEGSAGALELAARYSRIDLDDEEVEGGVLADWTAGLNWYLNPVTRVMANVVLGDVDDVGSLTAFMTRFQIDF